MNQSVYNRVVLDDHDDDDEESSAISPSLPRDEEHQHLADGDEVEDPNQEKECLLTRDEKEAENGDYPSSVQESMVVVQVRQWVAQLSQSWPTTTSGKKGGIHRSTTLWMALLVVITVSMISMVRHSRAPTPRHRLAQLKHDFEIARFEWETRLRIDYGSYYDTLFTRQIQVYDNVTQTNQTQTVSFGKFVLVSPNHGVVSAQRMKQRMMMKLLQVILAPSPGSPATPSTTTTPGSSLSSSAREAHEDNANKTQEEIEYEKKMAYYDPTPPPRTHPVSFVWATGGHSAAAGHGNLFVESYTAVMERMSRPIFASVGMDFEGRNYAEGGSSSYPEMALCVDEVYGTDIDVLSWDFGMTDGSLEPVGILQYFYHAGMNPNRPAVVAFDPPNTNTRPNANVMLDLEERGLTALILDPVDTFPLLPDNFGLTTPEIEQLPRFVRNIKCENDLERGEPFCTDDKWNNDFCTGRRFKTGWHPGWKWQAMRGNLMTLGLVYYLEEALQELTTMFHKQPSLDANEVLLQLRQQQDQDYQIFKTAELPQDAPGMLVKNPPKAEGHFTLEQLFTTPNFCHSALLPSEIRYKGILTDVADAGMVGPIHYDHGISVQNLVRRNYSDPALAKNDLMSLSFDQFERQQCEVPVNMDYKDFFLVHQPEGWKKLVLPTDAELKAYAHKKPTTSFLGRVGYCSPGCPWGHCEDGRNIKGDLIGDGHLEMRINGVPVTSTDGIGNCRFLLHGDGNPIFPLNEQGRFDIHARVVKEEAYVEFSAFLLW